MTAMRAREEAGIGRGIAMGLLFGAMSLVLMLVLSPIVGTIALPLASWIVILLWLLMPVLAGYVTDGRFGAAVTAGAVAAAFVVLPVLAMQTLRLSVFAIKVGFTDANFTGQRLSVMLAIVGITIFAAAIGLALGWIGLFLRRHST